MEEKRKIDYNSTIKYLISNYNKKKDINKLRSACKPVKDIDVNQVIDELYEERRRDEPTL